LQEQIASGSAGRDPAVGSPAASRGVASRWAADNPPLPAKRLTFAAVYTGNRQPARPTGRALANRAGRRPDL